MNRQPADLRRRIGAYLLDSVIAAAISGIGAGIFAGISVGTAGAFPLPVALVLASLVPLAWLLVYSAMQGGDGSLGMRMLGLELRHADDDGALGFGRALGRNLVWGVGAAVIVGMFSPLFDRSPWRRGWHDIAVGSVMIDALGAPAAAAPAAAEDVPAPLPIPPMAGFPSAAGRRVAAGHAGRSSGVDHRAREPGPAGRDHAGRDDGLRARRGRCHLVRARRVPAVGEACGRARAGHDRPARRAAGRHPHRDR